MVPAFKQNRALTGSRSGLCCPSAEALSKPLRRELKPNFGTLKTTGTSGMGLEWGR